jgi:hypothetical protein
MSGSEINPQAFRHFAKSPNAEQEYWKKPKIALSQFQNGDNLSDYCDNREHFFVFKILCGISTQ